MIRVPGLILLLCLYCSTASAQSIYLRSSDTLVYSACNQSGVLAEILQLKGVNFEVVTKLESGECFRKVIEGYSDTSDPEELFLLENGVLTRMSIDKVEWVSQSTWEKLLFVLIGAIAASLKSFFDLIFSPIAGNIKIMRRKAVFRQSLIEDLRHVDQEIEMDVALEQSLRGQGETMWLLPGVSKEIDMLRKLVSDVKSGSISRVDAIKKLGERP